MSNGRQCRVPGCSKTSHKGGALCSGHMRRKERGLKESDPQWSAPIMTPAERSEYLHRRNSPQAAAAPIVEPVTSYEDEWAMFRRWLGIHKTRKYRSRALSKTAVQRYGVISDTHIPFHDAEACEAAIDWLKHRKADTVYIGGDFLDCYSLSRFNQYQTVTLRDELVGGRLLLDHLSRTFAEVRMLSGNHESREQKYLSARVPAELYEYLMVKPILARVSEDMDNVHLEERTVADTKITWMTRVGDAVIGHPESQSKIPLRPAVNFEAWLHNWRRLLGIDEPRLVIIGHTHTAGMAWVGDCLVVEGGCLCRPQSYSLQPRIYGKPQRQAVTYFEQVDGVTDRNSVQQYYPEER